MANAHHHEHLSGPLLTWAFAVTLIAVALTMGVYVLLSRGPLGF